jgi:S1-C subfamily serine protease
MVVEVGQDSNAQRAGINGFRGEYVRLFGRIVIPVGGDIIVKIDDRSITSFSDISLAMRNKRPGDSMEIIVIRNGEVLNLSTQLR